ncbi:MAG: lytic transglycosylase domain-containing protein, partial [Anaerolineales bacterium]
LAGRDSFVPPQMYDFVIDWEAEKAEAEAWIREVFALPDGVDLTSPGPLAADPRLGRGTELWRLGLYESARAEFENLRTAIQFDPADNYRLANYLLDLGLYRTAIFCTRQILTLAGMDDAATMGAPPYFNHIRFKLYYDDLVLPLANEYDLHPLLLYSVIRQESLFEGFVRSVAGARGLMQIIPATGQGIYNNLGWPPGYTAEDLYRPVINVPYGADYLTGQIERFGGNASGAPPSGITVYAALAAYNGGPGNSAVWLSLADNACPECTAADPDLFLELVRFGETRNYIRGVYEIFAIYRRIYDRTP